jgi:hypothetical protein
LSRIPPDDERTAAIRSRCARHYATRQEFRNRGSRRGGLFALAVLSAAYLVEITRVLVRLYAP